MSWVWVASLCSFSEHMWWVYAYEVELVTSQLAVGWAFLMGHCSPMDLSLCSLGIWRNLLDFWVEKPLSGNILFKMDNYRHSFFLCLFLARITWPCKTTPCYRLDACKFRPNLNRSSKQRAFKRNNKATTSPPPHTHTPLTTQFARTRSDS